METIRLSKTVVNTTTLEELKELLTWHQRKNFVWVDGRKPLQDVADCFEATKEKTCVELTDRFSFGDIEEYKKEKYTILSLKEFRKRANTIPM